MKKPVVSIGLVVAFVTPYISVLSGILVAFLFVHLHILGIFHVSQSATAETIAGSVVFAVTAALHYAAAHYHWLPVVLENLKRPQLGAGASPSNFQGSTGLSGGTGKPGSSGI